MDLGIFGAYGFSVAIALTAIMIAVSGIVLGIAYAIEDKKLKETAKYEIYQSIANAVLIGILLVMFANNGIITTLINSVVESGSTHFVCQQFMSNNYAICFAYNYLIGVTDYTFMGRAYMPLLQITTSMLAMLLGVNIGLGVISGININLAIVSISFSGAILPFIKEISYIIGILTTISIGISVEASLLYFISLTSTTIILPAGLLLRAFRPSRKIGGFLVAVAIGMYVVFPLSYLFNAALVSSYSSNLNSTNMHDVVISAGSINNQMMQSMTASKNQTSGVISSLTSSVEGLLNLLTTYIISALDLLAGLIVQVFILPIFSIVLTGISIRELAGLLGSEAFFGRLNML
jgi:hypothetical protein